MCTVSWVHMPGGYHLFCNRDERKTRAVGLGARIERRGGVRFIAPVDAESGGTWIAVNEFGLSVCLLNGANLHGLESTFTPRTPQSRGLLLRELIWAESASECALWLRQIDLRPFAPFTVLMLEPRETAIVAWWDGHNSVIAAPGDSCLPLTSSSYDPEGVRESRRKEFARRRAAAGRIDAELLYEFHASHGGRADAYSPCMHRPDAETVSFSHVTVTRGEIRFFYSPAALCVAAGGGEESLRRAA
jgi:hypothetical protein